MAAEAPARLTKAGRLAALVLVVTAYLPWWAQRRFAASKAPIRVVVAGRQAGKTHAAAEEVVRIMIRRPGTQSCLLMPTYKSTKGPLKHLRRALSALGPPGRGKDRRWCWYEVDKVFRLWNGSELYVRTADDKDGVPTRGLTIDGVLWVDEAAYVPASAFEAARFTQGAVADPLVIITTSPAGRNWVFDEFNAGCPGHEKKTPLNESFRFRTTDSPYHNAKFVADLRRKVGPRRASQELDAEFLGDAHAAFNPDHIALAFKTRLAIRGEQRTLGVDLGKEQDYTVVTLMNEFGEAWVLGRWRDVEWPEQQRRIVELAQKHKALVVLAMGRGGGYGGMMYSHLKPILGEARLLEVRDAAEGVRGEFCELLIADFEGGRVKVDPGEQGPQGEQSNGQVLRHELTFFEAHRTVAGGKEHWRYHAPEGVSRDDEDQDNEDHDDCVISLGLANFGRVHGWSRPTAPTDLSAFARATKAAGQSKRPPQGGGGRIFGLRAA